MSWLWLLNQDIISLIRLMDSYYERLELCKSRGLQISFYFVNNQVFASEVAKKKWLDEFPSFELFLDRLEKRDPCFIPPTNTHHDYLYYHLLCAKKKTLKKSDELGFKINCKDVEVSVIGKNAIEYFSLLFN